MCAGEVALLKDFRFSLQPVLDMAPGRRALVDITEVRPRGHFVRIRRKIRFIMIQLSGVRMPGSACRLLVLILIVIFVHAASIVQTAMGWLWVVHPHDVSVVYPVGFRPMEKEAPVVLSSTPAAQDLARVVHEIKQLPKT